MPWYLDCSPKCRGDPNAECESDTFAKDPDHFMKQTYFDCDESDSQTCSNEGGRGLNRHGIPDYLICNSHDLHRMRTHLASLGMQEIGRFVQGITGVRVSNYLTVGDDVLFEDPEITKSSLFRDSVSMSFEELVLFQRKVINSGAN